MHVGAYETENSGAQSARERLKLSSALVCVGMRRERIISQCVDAA